MKKEELILGRTYEDRFGSQAILRKVSSYNNIVQFDNVKGLEHLNKYSKEMADKFVYAVEGLIPLSLIIFCNYFKLIEEQEPKLDES